MKKKINKQLMLISSMAVVITVLLMAAVFYRILQAQVIEDLKVYAYMLAQGGIPDGIKTDRNRFNKESMRITVIGSDGSVLYESDADVTAMDNHLERPEVQEAVKCGEGQIVRQSSTMGKNTFYYTVLLEDGSILRVARESHSIWSILYRSLPVFLMTLIVLLIVCLVLSRYLTKSLVSPIERMAANMDHIEEANVYEELVPFAETIKAQHDAILSNADMRQEFTANVSHELKTPLAAISGYSELIENGMASGQDAVRFASGIHQSANRLLKLINDTIRLSELDGMKQVEPFEEINLYELAKDSVEMLQIRAEDQGVILSMKGSPCTVQGDRQMLEELIYNLCDNAVCYNNPGGSVFVTVGVVENKTIFRVQDTGIGIPKESQERVFERFYRVDKSRSKSTGGTGLGLAIVKHIVAVHDARILLVSEVGKGTDITIIFSNPK